MACADCDHRFLDRRNAVRRIIRFRIVRSAWDSNWARNFGGSDSPETGERKGFIPARFVPRQNPFYLALPFNDVSGGRTKAESYKVIPWFQETFEKSGQSDSERAMGGDPKRKSGLLRPMGRCRSISQRSLGVCFRQRPAAPELESWSRPRCLACDPGLFEVGEHRSDGLAICRFSGSPAWSLGRSTVTTTRLSSNAVNAKRLSRRGSSG